MFRQRYTIDNEYIYIFVYIYEKKVTWVSDSETTKTSTPI